MTPAPTAPTPPAATAPTTDGVTAAAADRGAPGGAAPTGAPARPTASAAQRLAAAAGSGLLLAGAFPPLDLGPLALVALVPLLWAWRGAGMRLSAACGFTAGVAFFAVLVSWTWYFGAVAYVPFVVVLSVWWALAGALVGWLDRHGAASPPAVAGVWVLVEAARGWWPFGGFSWGEIGYAFHDLPVARSLAAWGGVLLVSYAAVAVNGYVLAAATALRQAGRRAARPAAAGIAGVIAVAVAAHVALPGTRPTGTLRVALVQGNDKNRDLTRAEVLDRYLSGNHLRLASGIDVPVDLVVLPESSIEADPRLDPLLDRQLTELAAARDAAVFAGGNTDAPGGRLYNTTFLYTAAGRHPDVYRKQHLVPFGEFVPWRSALSFIDALDAVPRDFAPGRDGTLFPVAGRPVGTLICFDSAFRALARDYARDGAEAILVSTNNRSYRRSANSAQHLAMSQLRAAETGRPVLHAGISGLSGVIDASGHLLARTSLFEATVLTAEVTTASGRTPYVAAGDWVLLLAAAVPAGVALRARRRAARRRAGGGRRS